jgi:Ser/Thr protein kinase RdoA (MazF antagonist)
MKIFRNSRNDQEVKDVIERAYVAEQNNVKSPKIYKNSNNEIITKIHYKDSLFRISIMQYIDGKNFFELNKHASLEELNKIVHIGSSLNKIDYKPNFIYDTWAINNFIQEFEKKKQYISDEYLKIIQPVYEKFKKFNYNELPKSFVHGDIIQTNLILDKNEDLWVIDFSVSNYIARLNEITVICCDLGIIPGNKEESIKRIKTSFNQWAKEVEATDLEKNSFKMLFEVANAIYLVNPLYEIARGNDSKENQMYLDLGIFGLSLDFEI